MTPWGARSFLGQFGNDQVSLSLSNLPDHARVSVALDLFIIRTWDGNSSKHGPDVWTLRIDGVTTLLNTTFGNDVPQAYPGTYPGSQHSAYTGAAEIETLGYSCCGGSRESLDSVYQLHYDFAHSGDSLTITFGAQGLQSLSDESWGIDNVRVELE